MELETGKIWEELRLTESNLVQSKCEIMNFQVRESICHYFGYECTGKRDKIAGTKNDSLKTFEIRLTLEDLSYVVTESMFLERLGD